MKFPKLISIFKTVILSLVFLLTVVSKVRAENEFTTSVRSEYVIDASGVTQVKKTFQLKNNFSTIYASRYGLEVGSNRLKDIKVTDKNGEIEANVVQTDNLTSIGIDFSDKIVGKDQVREFTISYEDPDTSLIIGKILEVRIPGVAEPSAFADYEVVIRVPEGFSSPALASPHDYQVEAKGTRTEIRYKNAGYDGISLIFGETQQYDFSLTYHLNNSSGSRGITQVALPPDTQYQQVTFRDISPRPEKIETDADGNWIATYILESEQVQTVVATGVVTVFLTPQSQIPQAVPSAELTKEDEYWPVNDPDIQTLAKDHTTPREIYDYVVEKLDYNYLRLQPDIEPQRLGAKIVLGQPDNAVCQEFTDLFITLARANGIPARQAVGYAFTQNAQIRPLSLVQDVLHAWPEYYDAEKKIWVPVDPTWGDTTGGVDYFSQFDFSHVVFALQGHSSQKPYPAGSYKRPDVTTKDIQIEPTTQEVSSNSDFALTLNSVSARLPWRSHANVEITNITGRAWYDIPVSLTLGKDVQLSETPQKIDRLLPYQSTSISFLLSSSELLKTQTTELSMQVDQNVLREQIVVAPQFFQFFGRLGYSSPLELILLGVGIFIGLTLLIVFLISILKKKK